MNQYLIMIYCIRSTVLPLCIDSTSTALKAVCNTSSPNSQFCPSNLWLSLMASPDRRSRTASHVWGSSFLAIWTSASTRYSAKLQSPPFPRRISLRVCEIQQTIIHSSSTTQHGLQDRSLSSSRRQVCRTSQPNVSSIRPQLTKNLITDNCPDCTAPTYPTKLTSMISALRSTPSSPLTVPSSTSWL